MKKQDLWKILMVGLVCLTASCEFPESITVKGSPELYIPLGSPFGEGRRIEDMLGFGAIREMMGAAGGDGLTMYDYRGYARDVQAYIMRCKIAELSLDLSEYVSALDLINNGSVVSAFIPGTGAAIPITVPLGTMTEWITDIDGANFTLTLTFRDAVPGSGVSVEFQGLNGTTPVLNPPGTPVNNTLTFSTGPFNDFNPSSSQSITLRITVPPGTMFKPSLGFEWVSAEVHPQRDGGDYEGEYPFTLGDMLGYLGEGVAFKTIPTYMYMDLPGGASTLELQANETVLPGNPIHAPLPNPIKNPAGRIDQTGMFNGMPYYEFRDLFNAGEGSADDPVELHYKITMTSLSITKAADRDKTITVDMLIVLPLEFEVSNPSSSYPGYVSLDLGGGLSENLGEGDLFGRTGGGDGLLSALNYVTIRLKDIENTALPGINLAIKTAGHDWEPIPLTTGRTEDVTIDHFDYPFSPAFEMLLRKDSGVDTGTLKVAPMGNNLSLNFLLAVEAQAEINQTINL